MAVALEWAPAAHLKEHVADDDKIPEPQLDDWLLPVWRCWHRLHLDRPHYGGGMGPMVPGRISWSAVREWAEHYDMTADEFDFLDHCIRAMDDEFLRHHAASAKKAAPK